jgi:hypothetical protein
MHQAALAGAAPQYLPEASEVGQSLYARFVIVICLDGCMYNDRLLQTKSATEARRFIVCQD